jgi:hypothetical protein
MHRLVGLLFASFAALALTAAAGADEPKKDKDKTDSDLPITIKVIAKKDKYPLDLGGKKAEDFKKEIKDGEKTGKLPAPPAVDLEVELKNTSDKNVEVWISGDATDLSLDVKGPGAMTVEGRKAFTTDFRLPKPMTLEPGKTYTFTVSSLSFGFRGAGKQAYWTEAGEYTIAASFKTGIAPPPKSAKEARDGFGLVTLTSEPVKITVEEKK